MPNRKNTKKTAPKKAAGKPASGARKITTAGKKAAAPKISATRKPAAKKPAAKKPAVKTAAKPKSQAQTAAKPVPETKVKKPQTQRDRILQSIKSQLVHQKEILLSEAESALNELPGQTIFPDLGDQASAEIDRDFLLRLRGREQRLLKKIDEAIDRIDNGTFGICDDCGNEIDIKRLLARPVTTMCIECKTLQEEEERRRES
ncbi:MAG: hypothetical protein OHK006_01230 [Thermodesulfovibrionales bacterium]